MKASELMIGDWVLYHKTRVVGCPSIISKNPIDEYIRVESVVQEGVNEEYFQGDLDWIEWDEIDPIPLTEEILKVNGFDLSICCEFYRHKYNKNLKFKLLGNELIICFGKLKTIQYVHELQHALRLCGLNDLADNFKIE